MSGTPSRWRTSYRRHIIVGVLIVVLASVVGQFLVSTAIRSRVESAERRALQQQAQVLANEVSRVPDRTKGSRAADVARFLPDTRVVVTWKGTGGELWYNLAELSRGEAEATAQSQNGAVEVRLSREYNRASTSPWAIVAIIALVGVIATVVFIVAESVVRRLRRQVTGLANTASAFAAGDWSARVLVSDDELGRAASAFNHMADQLEEADSNQRRFLADVAHELRTPVTTIDGFAAALGDGAAVDDEDRAEAITFIREEAVRLRDLVTDLRNLTALDLGGAALKIASVDLAERAQNVVQRFAAGADDAGITLETRGESVVVQTDERHVDTIMSNLVSNALAATPEKGSISIEVAALADGGVEFVVRDTGRGIAEEDLGRVFDRLYRVDRARSRDEGGSGLGLAIVKRLITQLGGTIDVASALGLGTAFTVTLPSQTPTPSTATASTSGDSSDQQ